jgi:hypothetical protein
MIGILHRLPHVVCEVGTCTWRANHTEYVTVIPGDPSLKDERHRIDVVLCQRHDEEFENNGLMGVITAHGDTITKAA